MILALAKDPAVDRFDIGSVRRIVSGGAPLGADLAVAAGERLGCEVVQGYGMTETSAVASLTPPGPSPLGTVGKLLPGMQLRIVGLGAGAGPHPDGIGELQFRGPNIMHGYMGDDPASAFTEDGWLPSGDIGRRDADGFLYIVDRSKEVLKYKGFQVAPAELEAVLVTHPDVVDAGVIGMPDEESGELPVAFVVADTTVSEPELLDYCTRKLAHYKRVHHIMFVESIPRSESGKILRRELRRLLSGGS